MHALLRESLGGRKQIRRHDPQLPGKPDFVIPSLKLIIFVDGCFYHGCPSHGHVPKSNTAYWKTKIERNTRRDAANRRKLRAMGYAVWRFWEHELENRNLPRARRRLALCVARRIK